MTSHHRTGSRPLFGAGATPWVGLAVLGLALIGCSTGSESSAGSIAGVDDRPSASAPASSAAIDTPVTTITDTTVPPAPPPTVASPAPAVDGSAVLQAAVANLAAGYHYRSTVSIGGVTTLEVDGDRVGSGTRLAVVRDGAAVQYVITPEGTWVLPDGGEWDQLDTPAATVDPITALSAPTAVSVGSEGPDAVTLIVSVPNAALGLPGDGGADLDVTVTNGALTNVVYRSVIEGQEAIVDTTVGPAVDPAEVVPPI